MTYTLLSVRLTVGDADDVLVDDAELFDAHVELFNADEFWLVELVDSVVLVMVV